MSFDQHQQPPPPPLIWFQLLDSATGEPFKGTRVVKVAIASSADVADFLKAVHAENPKRLSSFDAAELIVYKNKDAFERKEAPLEEDLLIGNLGSRKADALVVVVPEQNSRFAFPSPSQDQVMPSLFSALNLNPAALATSRTIIAALHSIRRARLVSNDDENLKTLEFDSFTFIDNRKYERLLIRECYPEFLVSAPKPGGDILTTILGTPGIGKSMFLLYCVWKFLQDGYTIVYAHFWMPNLLIVVDKNSARLMRNDEIIQNSALICDTFYPNGMNATHRILAVSPRLGDDASNEFKKLGGHIFRYMPPWKESEFESYLDVFHPAISEKERAGYMKRFEIFGGIPRTILQITSSSAEKQVDKIVLKWNNLQDLFSHIGTMSHNCPPSFHALIHMKSESNFENFEYVFASKYVAKRLAAMVTLADLKEAVAYLRWKKCFSLAGDLFEPLAMFILAEGGQFKYKNLNNQKERDIDLPKLKFKTGNRPR